MRIDRSTIFSLLVIAAACSSPAHDENASHAGHAAAKHGDARAAAAGAARFAADFYAWYATLPTKDEPEWITAVDRRRSSFSPELARALRADWAAQQKAEGVIVGLDFDPVFASQDPCERYVPGAVTHAGGVYRVPMHSICGGRRSADPAVVPEVEKRGGAWTFVNFRYPDGGRDLLGVLKKLREEEQ